MHPPTNEMSLLLPPELVRTNTQLLNLNVADTRFIFNSSVTAQKKERKKQNCNQLLEYNKDNTS